MTGDDADDGSMVDRRSFLTSVTVGLGALAGCTNRLGRPPSADEPPDVQQSGEFSEDTYSAAEDVGKRLRDSVVVIEGELPGSNSATGGTGWYYGDGLIITNGHVIKPAESVSAWTLAGDKLSLETVNATLSPDVGVLRVADGEQIGVPAVSTETEPSLSEGQPLVHVGHPYAIGNWVIGMGRYVRTGMRGVLTTVASMSGFSGSPVVTLDQTCIGMTSGSVPRQMRGQTRGEAPEPVTPEVHDEFEDYKYTTHVPMQSIQERISEWTE